MAALTVWLFEARHADDVLDSVSDYKARGLVDIFDAAMITWEAGADRPALTPLPDLAGEQRFEPAFWTRLYGLTFFPASLGVGISAAGAAATREELGVTPTMAATLRTEVHEGMAALFIYSSGAFATGRLVEEMARFRADIPAQLLSSNLSIEEDAKLQARLRPSTS